MPRTASKPAKGARRATVPRQTAVDRECIRIAREGLESMKHGQCLVLADARVLGTAAGAALLQQ